MNEYTDELNPVNCAAHDAVGVLSMHRGYSCTLHWLCLSPEAKAEGLGYVYGMSMAKGIHYDNVKSFIERNVPKAAFEAWKKREIEAAVLRES